MVIKTDYVAGEDYKASDHNNENTMLLMSQRRIKNLYNTPYGLLYSTDDARVIVGYTSSTGGLIIDDINKRFGSISTSSLWGISMFRGAMYQGGYLYAGSGFGPTNIVRIDLSDDSTTTLSGFTPVTFTCDGTYFYTNSGASLQKYSLSGTTFTLVDTIAYGGSTPSSYQVHDGKVYYRVSSTFYVYDQSTASLITSFSFGITPTGLVKIGNIVAATFNSASSMTEFVKINI